MKKLIPFFLIVSILLLSACGTGSGSNNAANTGNNAAVSGEQEAEPVTKSNTDKKETQPQEPKYELSECSLWQDGPRKGGYSVGYNEYVEIDGCYWLTNNDSIPIEITSFSAEVFDKDGVHVGFVSVEDYDVCDFPIAPGGKRPIRFTVHETENPYALEIIGFTKEDIGKIVPEVSVKFSDKLLTEIPYTFDQNQGEVAEVKTIVENNTNEEIVVLVLINKYDPNGKLLCFGGTEETIKPGYKEPVITGLFGTIEDNCSFEVSAYRVTQNPDITTTAY